MHFFRAFLLRKKYKKEERLRTIARYIGEFYLFINEDKKLPIEELYRKANFDIEVLGISRLDFKDGKVIITLSRPGMLIGRHGSNIEALEKFLKGKVSGFNSIHIIEDCILWALHPSIPTEIDYDY